MKNSIISIHKSELIFWKKNLSVLSMWKLTLGYGIGIKLGFFYLQSFKSSNPVMFISCTYYGHLDLLLFLFVLYTSISVLQLTTQRPARILLVYLEVKLQSQIFFICARWPSVLENKISALEAKKKEEVFFLVLCASWFPWSGVFPPPTPTQLFLRWVLILGKPRSDAITLRATTGFFTMDNPPITSLMLSDDTMFMTKRLVLAKGKKILE